MRNIKFIKNALVCVSAIAAMSSCTNLEEQILDGTVQSDGAVITADYLTTAYKGLRTFQDQGNMYALDEMSTDALAGPTRGGDWDDNGAWRQIHVHTWDAGHAHVKDSWNILYSNVYRCNQVIYNSSVPAEVAQARFLRAFYYYHIVDLFGQAAHREKGVDKNANAEVWTPTEATNFIITELEAVLPSLPAKSASTIGVANQDAARFLLAKTYLNKAVFTDEDRVGPFTFAQADMTKVVTYVDAMSSTSSLTTDYWDNFSPTNGTSPELIFASVNTGGGDGGGLQSRWRMGTHYNQYPSGWNGFATVADFYSTFDANDRRIKNNDASIKADFGNGVGILIGQVRNGKNRDEKGRDENDSKVKYTTLAANTLDVLDRNGSKLIFTPLTKLIITGSAIESEGYRPMKYIPDAANLEKPENEYVLFRYADALLMKAEAIKRGGTAGSGGMSVAAIQSALAARALPAVVSVDLSSDAGILKARGNELWLEGWRRNDLIRFGKFLEARTLKPAVSDKKYLVYPIPSGALLNPNLKQNSGY